MVARQVEDYGKMVVAVSRSVKLLSQMRNNVITKVHVLLSLRIRLVCILSCITAQCWQPLWFESLPPTCIVSDDAL